MLNSSRTVSSSHITSKVSKPWVIKKLALIIISLVLIAGIIWVVIPMQKAVHDFQQSVIFDAHKLVRLHEVSRVYTIEKDPFDTTMLWFGTAEGIHVLNTTTFEWRRIGLDHGLPSEKVTGFCFTSDRVWISTLGGMCSLKRGANLVDSCKSAQKSPSRIVALVNIPGIGVVGSAQGEGLFVVRSPDSVPQPFKVSDGIDCVTVTSLRMISGSLFVGTNAGILVSYDIASGKVTKIPCPGSVSKSSTIWDVLQRPEGLYIATSDAGVYVKKTGCDTAYEDKSFPCKGAFCFSNEEDGFFCATPYGLWRYHAANTIWLQFVNPAQQSPTDFSITSLVSSGDLLWYGVLDGKSGYLTKTRVTWQPLRAGLSHPNVAALAVDDSVMWTSYGYQSGFLDRFSSNTLQYHHNYGLASGISDPTIQTLFASHGVLFYGGFESFGWIAPDVGTGRHYTLENGLPHADIAAIVPESRTTLLLASSSGILRYVTINETFEILKESGIDRTTCMALSDTTLWYGTLAGGVKQYDIRHQKIVATYGENVSRIMGIFMLDENNLFVVTKTNGCYTINSALKRWNEVAIPKALYGTSMADDPNNCMCARQIDGRMYLGTRDHGCFVYTPSTKHWNTISFFDGLVTDQIRSFDSDSVNIYIGGYGGVTKIPKQYIDSLFLAQKK